MVKEGRGIGCFGIIRSDTGPLIRQVRRRRFFERDFTFGGREDFTEPNGFAGARETRGIFG